MEQRRCSHVLRRLVPVLCPCVPEHTYTTWPLPSWHVYFLAFVHSHRSVHWNSVFEETCTHMFLEPMHMHSHPRLPSWDMDLNTFLLSLGLSTVQPRALSSALLSPFCIFSLLFLNISQENLFSYHFFSLLEILHVREVNRPERPWERPRTDSSLKWAIPWSLALVKLGGRDQFPCCADQVDSDTAWQPLTEAGRTWDWCQVGAHHRS